MAQVNIDFSEFDMLRENLKKANEHIEELKKENEEYKKGARVIIKTEKIIRDVDEESLAHELFHAWNALNGCSISNRASDDYNSLAHEMAKFGNTVEYWVNVIDNAKEFKPGKASDSCQYIGFDDIKYTVESDMRERARKELDVLKQEQETKTKECRNRRLELENEYAKKSKELENKYGNDLTTTKRKLSELQDIEKQYRNLERQINDLLQTVNLKQDSLDFEKEQNAQLQKELDECKTELHKYKSRNFLRRLFNF